ncbi:MAG: hypothetical protein IKJ07_03125 [Clostridia bacterium]|nr:hypothetical protein [Clostridia bacterium]
MKEKAAKAQARIAAKKLPTRKRQRFFLNEKDFERESCKSAGVDRCKETSRRGKKNYLLHRFKT